jgi:hypothetical protein
MTVALNQISVFLFLEDKHMFDKMLAIDWEYGIMLKKRTSVRFLKCIRTRLYCKDEREEKIRRLYNMLQWKRGDKYADSTAHGSVSETEYSYRCS